MCLLLCGIAMCQAHVDSPPRTRRSFVGGKSARHHVRAPPHVLLVQMYFSHTHTHTHTNTQTHIHIRKHTYTYTYKRIHKHTLHTNAHRQTCAVIQAQLGPIPGSPMGGGDDRHRSHNSAAPPRCVISIARLCSCTNGIGTSASQNRGQWGWSLYKGPFNTGDYLKNGPLEKRCYQNMNNWGTLITLSCK